MTDINKELSQLVNDIVALGTDHSNDPPTPQNEAEAIAKIKALVVDSLPKNEPHRKDCPANGFTCVCEMWKQNRNQCLGEIRSIWQK